MTNYKEYEWRVMYGYKNGNDTPVALVYTEYNKMGIMTDHTKDESHSSLEYISNHPKISTRATKELQSKLREKGAKI